VKALLILILITVIRADDAFAKGERIGLIARDDVVLELWRPVGSNTARVLFKNRNDLPVRVTYVVGVIDGAPAEYEAELDGNESIPFENASTVDTTGQWRPVVRIVRVAKVPIEEASGYVLIAKDNDAALGIMLFRPMTGGNRAYAVIANSGRFPLTVTWQATGLSEAPPLTFTTVAPARATLGRDGSIPLVYHPAADPREFERARVRILSSVKAP
jgi:hypothetical protein